MTTYVNKSKNAGGSKKIVSTGVRENLTNSPQGLLTQFRDAICPQKKFPHSTGAVHNFNRFEALALTAPLALPMGELSAEQAD